METTQLKVFRWCPGVVRVSTASVSREGSDINTDMISERKWWHGRALGIFIRDY